MTPNKEKLIDVLRGQNLDQNAAETLACALVDRRPEIAERVLNGDRSLRAIQVQEEGWGTDGSEIGVVFATTKNGVVLLLEKLSADDAQHLFGYPQDWPRCKCGDFCLDGKATCGRVEC